MADARNTSSDRKSKAAIQRGRIFVGYFLIRRDGVWSESIRGRFAVNPAIFGDDDAKRKHIENAAAGTFGVAAANVFCTRFKSKDGVFEWSASAALMLGRTTPVETKNETPVPSGLWIAEMDEDDILEAAEKFELKAADFDDSHTLLELRQNLAFALHGESLPEVTVVE